MPELIVQLENGEIMLIEKDRVRCGCHFARFDVKGGQLINTRWGYFRQIASHCKHSLKVIEEICEGEINATEIKVDKWQN